MWSSIPGYMGDPSLHLERNTLPLFALDIPQKLAKEMTTELYMQKATAVDQACQSGDAART